MLTLDTIKNYCLAPTLFYGSPHRPHKQSRTVLLCIFLLGCTPTLNRKGSTSSNYFNQPYDTSDHWHDTGDWSATVQAVYGCNVPPLGVCYDHYTTEGWDEQSSIASCELIESQYMVSDSFIDNPGCPTHNAVGECELRAGGDFAYAVTLLYNGSLWTGSAAESDCIEKDGEYYGF